MKNIKFLVYLTFLVWLLPNNLSCLSAKSQKHRKQGTAYEKISFSEEKKAAISSNSFNVVNYGAKGDGIADDTNAFERAWSEACKVKGSVVIVPSGSVFLVKPISFSGANCQSNIVFQLDGKIIAPKSSGAWGSGLLQWLEFTKLQGITIRGKGIIDGQGSVWWNNDLTTNPESEAGAEASPDWVITLRECSVKLI